MSTGTTGPTVPMGSTVTAKKPAPTNSQRFKDNMIDLIGYIKELLGSLQGKIPGVPNPYLIDLGANYLVSTYDDIKIIEGFIRKSNKHWHKIKIRDENFFIIHSKEIFELVPNEVMDTFVSLFKFRDSNNQIVINSDDREVLWKYFDSFVKISIKYIFEKREPFWDTSLDPKTIAFRVDFERQIRIKKMASEWGVKLIVDGEIYESK